MELVSWWVMVVIGKKINNIGPAALNDNTQLTNLKTMYLRMEDSSVTFRA